MPANLISAAPFSRGISKRPLEDSELERSVPWHSQSLPRSPCSALSRSASAPELEVCGLVKLTLGVDRQMYDSMQGTLKICDAAEVVGVLTKDNRF